MAANEIGFHVTTAEAFEVIRTEGLRPAIGPRSNNLGETLAQTYFFKSKDATEDGLMGWLGECFDEDAELVVLEVDLSGLQVTAEPDQFELSTTQQIAADRILNVYDEEFQLKKSKRASP